MTTDYQSLKLSLADSIAEALKTLSPEPFESAELAEMFEVPPTPDLGDLALPCFKLSKRLRKGPPMIASSIAENLHSDLLDRAVAEKGYLNLYIRPSYYTETLLDGILEAGDRYGSSDEGAGKTVVLDYSSPNVCKPFHIGHLGTTVIGHSLRLLYEFTGWKTVAVNHLGDWGTQFGKMMVAFRKWGSKERVEQGGCDELVDLYVRFHKEAEEDPSLNDVARAEFTKLEQGDPENLALWKWFLDISIREYKKTYRQLGIEFDYYTGESFYTDKMPEQIQLLRDKGLLEIDDGASIVKLDQYGMPPCLFLKRDGSTLYPARDIAAAVYRKRTFNFDKCVYVTSSGQSLHFAQWFKVAELMGYDWYTQLEHVPYGTVSVNGAKLSTRSGNVVLLKELFAQAEEKVASVIEEKSPGLENKAEVCEAVGVGAVIFNYLMNSRIKDTNFVLEDALSFEGNTGPYAQYTHARCCSVLEKAGGLPAPVSGYAACDAEMDLLRVLAFFPEKVKDALTESEPSIIVRYILDVCAAYNRFYHECRILTAEDEKSKAFRVRLSAASMHVLRTALRLVCMKAPEKI